MSGLLQLLQEQLLAGSVLTAAVRLALWQVPHPPWPASVPAACASISPALSLTGRWACPAGFLRAWSPPMEAVLSQLVDLVPLAADPAVVRADRYWHHRHQYCPPCALPSPSPASFPQSDSDVLTVPPRGRATEAVAASCRTAPYSTRLTRTTPRRPASTCRPRPPRPMRQLQRRTRAELSFTVSSGAWFGATWQLLT